MGAARNVTARCDVPRRGFPQERFGVVSTLSHSCVYRCVAMLVVWTGVHSCSLSRSASDAHARRAPVLVAQRKERLPPEQKVAGSNPVRDTQAGSGQVWLAAVGLVEPRCAEVWFGVDWSSWVIRDELGHVRVWYGSSPRSSTDRARHYGCRSWGFESLRGGCWHPLWTFV